MTEEAGPLGRIYTLDEAAAYLRTTKQAVARAANKSGAGARFGRDIRFHDDDVRALWEAMRTRPTGNLYAECVSTSLSVEKASASLRNGALVERQTKAAERQCLKEAGKRGREETLSEKAARLLTNGKRRKP